MDCPKIPDHSIQIPDHPGRSWGSGVWAGQSGFEDHDVCDLSVIYLSLIKRGEIKRKERKRIKIDLNLEKKNKEKGEKIWKRKETHPRPALSCLFSNQSKWKQLLRIILAHIHSLVSWYINVGWLIYQLTCACTCPKFS